MVTVITYSNNNQFNINVNNGVAIAVDNVKDVHPVN